MRKNKSGITLIALVITIIVLLILAGISISMLSGDNSILQRATDARDKTETSNIEEQLYLAILSAETEEPYGEITTANLEKYLNDTTGSYLLKPLRSEEEGKATEWKVTIEGSEKSYRINDSGEILQYTLPTEYQEVEWIVTQSSKSNEVWFESRVNGNNDNLEIEIKYMLYEVADRTYLFGNYKGEEYNTTRIWIQNLSGRGWTCDPLINMPYETVANYLPFDTTLNVWNVDKVTREYYYHNKKSTVIKQRSGAENNNIIVIFNTGLSGHGCGTYGRIGYFKVWDEGELIRNYIPCYKIDDGTIGLYDTINQSFCPNSGTGTLTKGNDI